RRNLITVYFVSMCVNIGMWFERFVIIVISLHRDFLPSSWAMYYPTWVDLAMFAGSFLLFIRFLPIIAIAEIKSVLPAAQTSGSHNHGDYQPDGTQEH